MSRAKDQCFVDLAQRILAMELAPGTALDEAPLAAAYGISRTPLREVLQRLAGEGYVELTGNRGAQVAAMDVARLRVFFQTAPMVYANVGRLAAENRTDAQVSSLRDAQAEFLAATADGSAHDAALANHRFHAITVDMAANPYLAAAMGRLLIDHTRLGHLFYRPSTAEDHALIETAGAQHDSLIDAIARRDGARAADLSLLHWDLSRVRLERFVFPAPLPVSPEKERVDAV